jgi:ABC-type transporter lipoprotein component MlaA
MKRSLALVTFLLLLTAAGCSSIETQHRDWSGYTGPGAQHFAEEEVELPLGIRDPAQPFNRGLYEIHIFLGRWVVSPITTGWRFVFPEVVRDHIDQAGTNLAFPTRAINQLVQGEFSAAGTETMRFVINTTVGLLGFFDPADSWGIEAPEKEDTGQSLQAAGWDDPAFLFVPVIEGPSTTRDTVGLVGDVATNIAFWLGLPVSAFFQLNEASDAILPAEQLVSSAPDPYAIMRLAWSVLRGSQVEDYPTEPSQGVAGQTMQAVFMRPAEPAFFRSDEDGEVEIPTTGRVLPYSYWLQDDTAPVLYILPGLGSHRVSNQPLAMADAALHAGWSVVIVSSAMHPEFMDAASTAVVPGFAPVDARDVRVSLDAIDRQLSERYGARLGPRALSGLSMGAFHALYVAAEQERAGDDGLLRFDLFGVGAPPVSLTYGVEQLDDFYNAPMDWPADDRDRHVRATLQRVAALADGTLHPGEPLPFSEEEARFLVGLNFRITLVDLLWASQQRNDQGVLLTERDPDDREPAYREMLEYSWMEYFYAFVLPWVQSAERVASADEALALCDLHSVESSLARCQTLHVYMSDNDFLRRPEDNELLRRVVPPERLHVTEGGAHLGNGWNAAEMVRIMTELRAALDVGAAGGPSPGAAPESSPRAAPGAAPRSSPAPSPTGPMHQRGA